MAATATLDPKIEKLKSSRAALSESWESIRAAKKFKKIVEARKNYMPFVHLMMPDPVDPEDVNMSRYKEAHFHTLLAQQLEKIEAGGHLRTIITLPPGHGKSELAAKKYIPWFVGRDPYRHCIFAGYSDTFAEGTGRAVRDLMGGKLYRQVFPLCELAKGSASSSYLKTTEGGEIIFVGVGGQATGKRAHLLVIDDPIKNREEADNILMRNKLWDWFNDVAMTRLADITARVIIIQTRWHEDDLMGRLLDPSNSFYQKGSAEEWEIFDIPALAEDNDCMGRKRGEALWPEKFTREYLENVRRSNPRGFAALYQGKPAPDDGEFFKKEWIKVYEPEDLPDNLTMYACSDHAVTEKQDRDATVLMPFGVDAFDNVYIMSDVWWHRRQTPEVVEAMLALMQKYQFLYWSAENGHISKSIGPFLNKRQHEERIYCPIREMTPTKSKMARAQSIQARMSMGKVYFPKYAYWMPEAIGEMLKFPSAKHDDFVDTIAWVGITLGKQFGNAIVEKEADVEQEVGTIGWMKHSEEWEKRQKEMESQDGY